ncbi:hypothetical protein BH09ACT5_BH09ACT5_00080 [soil metagenome]
MTSPGAYSAIADLSAPFSTPPSEALTDPELLDAQRELAEIRRRVDAASAALAGEIEHRSRPELGYNGLAQRLGARTAAALVQRATGNSARESHTLVRVGTLMRTPQPWLGEVAEAIAMGRLSVSAADALRSGLGTPTAEVPAGVLASAASTLLD